MEIKKIKVSTSMVDVDMNSVKPCSYSEQDESIQEEIIKEYPENFLKDIVYPETYLFHLNILSINLRKDYQDGLGSSYRDPEEYIYFLDGLREEGIEKPYQELQNEFNSKFYRVELISKSTSKLIEVGYMLKY